MPSFSSVNYSLRPSKSIQRHVVFDCLSLLKTQIDLCDAHYIGLGSVWFTDFVLAHKLLGISKMISIELDDIGVERARFNAPYSMVSVKAGHSNAVLPTLLEDQELLSHPWIVWMDYDFAIDETVIDDIRLLVEKAPPNSVLLFTANAVGSKYGPARDRPDEMRNLFGTVVPDDLSKKACRDERLQETLSDLSLNFMKGIASGLSRPGGFIPAFSVPYKDGTPMVTFGGVLPSTVSAECVKALVASDEWSGVIDNSIVAPHLTLREAGGLQALLPKATQLTRAEVHELGFDLSDEELAVFQTYYKYYPSFAQVVA